VDRLVSADAEDAVLDVLWENDDVLTIRSRILIERGFEREGESRKTRMLATFPTDVIAADMGKGEIAVVVEVRKHPGE
jgi:hypothetical protein